jgi:hypothetical protein
MVAPIPTATEIAAPPSIARITGAAQFASAPSTFWTSPALDVVHVNPGGHAVASSRVVDPSVPPGGQTWSRLPSLPRPNTMNNAATYTAKAKAISAAAARIPRSSGLMTLIFAAVRDCVDDGVQIPDSGFGARLTGP